MARSPPFLQSLLRFLKQARQTHLSFISGDLPSSSRAETPIYVVGNPSADLDSAISVIVYSYFAHNRIPIECPRPHIPLINLPNVPSGPELRRLRPEVVKAFCLATTTPSVEGEDVWDETPETAGRVLHEHILTVADFAAHLKQYHADHTHRRISADATLLDWNALPHRAPNGQREKGSIDGLPSVDFCTVGCIDHHVDEGFLPPVESLPRGQPLLVRPAGSCTSLVVSTLRELDLWQADPEGNTISTETMQLAKLALAPVLIDTTNLTAKDKVTDADTDAVQFLVSQIDRCKSTSGSAWERDAFYEQILHAKQNSLDLLTVDEILGRDYKQWTETAHQDSSSIQIGFCSMVKSIPWIVRKAGSPEAFLDVLQAFAKRRELGIVVVMTAFTSSAQDGRFCRELVACGLDDGPPVQALETFTAQAGPQLGLQEWKSVEGDSEDYSQAIKCAFNGDAPVWRRIWLQKDVTKSRKQVAPLVRGAVTGQ
ncbi:putative exopolyphosphatase [Aspergillus udagawae]|uniref:Exopolyphosphatase n=1 Tax=Aspergillus udagawae TaxID=91492 RepID=A0A8E0UY17_9EURO|nr:exopolyphosphatase [Aspergillus udagawae]GIC90042.1 exopolyphosphatase [Aspergillus udagawae]